MIKSLARKKIYVKAVLIYDFVLTIAKTVQACKVQFAQDSLVVFGFFGLGLSLGVCLGLCLSLGHGLGFGKARAMICPEDFCRSVCVSHFAVLRAGPPWESS